MDWRYNSLMYFINIILHTTPPHLAIILANLFIAFQRSNVYDTMSGAAGGVLPDNFIANVHVLLFTTAKHSRWKHHQGKTDNWSNRQNVPLTSFNAVYVVQCAILAICLVISACIFPHLTLVCSSVQS